MYGVCQFNVVKKLKLLKKPLRALLFKQGNLHRQVCAVREALGYVQKEIDRDPFNVELHEKETTYIQQLQQVSLDEERFLKQKYKVKWLAAGDANTAFFHMSLKRKNHRNLVEVIKDANGRDGGCMKEMEYLSRLLISMRTSWALKVLQILFLLLIFS